MRAAGVSALDFRFGDLLGPGKIHQIGPAATRPSDALAARTRGLLAVGVRSSPHSGGNVGVTGQKGSTMGTVLGDKSDKPSRKMLAQEPRRSVTEHNSVRNSNTSRLKATKREDVLSCPPPPGGAGTPSARTITLKAGRGPGHHSQGILHVQRDLHHGVGAGGWRAGCLTVNNKESQWPGNDLSKKKPGMEGLKMNCKCLKWKDKSPNFGSRFYPSKTAALGFLGTKEGGLVLTQTPGAFPEQNERGFFPHSIRRIKLN